MPRHNTEKYLDYIDQKAPIAPANSQEELQAAEALADVFEAHGLEAQIEEFVASGAAKSVRAVLRILAFIGLLVAHMGSLPLALLGTAITIFCLVVLLLDATGHTILVHNTPAVRSQNVVAVHRATGNLVSKGNRPIVIVAHYDTKRCNPLRTPGIVSALPILSLLAFWGLFVAVACTIVQPIFVLGMVRTVLWVVGLISLIPSLVVGIATIAEKFSGYSEGANDNKASIAALLSVLNVVRPNDHDLDGLYTPQEVRAEQEAAERRRSEQEQAARREAEQRAQEAAPAYESPAAAVARLAKSVSEPRYEQVEGVRHGKELLEQLGILPATCEIEYVEPQLISPAGSSPEAESEVNVEPVIEAEAEPTISQFESEEETELESPSNVEEAANKSIDEQADNETFENTELEAPLVTEIEPIVGEPEVLEAEVEPEAEFEPEAVLEQDDEFIGAETEEAPLAEAAAAAEELPTAVVEPLAHKEPSADAPIAEVEPTPIAEVATVGVNALSESAAAASGELPIIGYNANTSRPKVSRQVPAGFMDKVKSIFGIPTERTTIVDKVARMATVEPIAEDETLSEEAVAEVTPVVAAIDELPTEDETSAAVTCQLSASDIDAAARAQTEDDFNDVEEVEPAQSPEVTAQFTPITDEMLPVIDPISPETSDQFDTVPPAALENLAQEPEVEVAVEPENEVSEEPVVEPEIEEAAEDAEVPEAEIESYQVEPSIPMADFSVLPESEFEYEPPVATAEAFPAEVVPKEDFDSEAESESVEVGEVSEDEVPEAVIEPIPDWMNSLMSQQSTEQPEASGDVEEETDLAEESLDQEVVQEEASLEAAQDETEEPVEEEVPVLPTAEFVRLDAEPKADKSEKKQTASNKPMPRAMPNSYDGETDEGAMYITSEFPIITPEQIAQGTTESPEITAQFTVIEGALSDAPQDNTEPPKFKGDGDTSGLSKMGTEDPDGAGADPEPQAPPMPADPEWGTTDFTPNVAKRAALFDLPDPTKKETDPFANQDPDVTAPTRKTTMAKLPGFEGAAEADAQSKPERRRTVRKSRGNVPTKRLDAPQKDIATKEENLERKKKRQLFGKRKNREEESLSSWLGVEDDFDARRDGREIGSWDHFDDDPDWKGGAAINAPYRVMDITLDEDGTPDPDELRDAILGMGDDELIAHDIWFVCLGASSLDHAGMEAFLEEHRKSIRGSFVVNLDSIGAGDLTLLSQEGLYRKRRADRRLVRLLMGIAHDLKIALPTKKHTWAETDVTQAMRSSLRSVTLMGTGPSSVPAQSGTNTDVYETVDHKQISDVVRLVCELIRRS